MSNPLTDIPKLSSPRGVKSSDVDDTPQDPIGIRAVNLSRGGFKYGDSLGAHILSSQGKSDDNDQGDEQDGDDKPKGSGEGRGNDPPSDDGSDNDSNQEEGTEEEEHTTDQEVPDLHDLVKELKDVKEQIKDLTSQKWKIEDQIVEHYSDSKEAKEIKRRRNSNVSRASNSAFVEEAKNTLVSLYVKKDGTVTEDFKVRMNMSGGKFIQMVADRFNVKKTKFYLNCPNGDLLQGGNRILFNQKLKADDVLTISFRGGGGAKRVKAEMKAEHKIGRLQAKLRADNRQCDDAEVDSVVIALEGVKKYLVDGVDVQGLLNDSPLDTLKAVLALTPKGETGRATMSKLEDVAKELLPPLKQLSKEITTVKDIYADVFHTFLDDYANRYNSTKTKDATLNHRDFTKAVEDAIAYKEKVVMNQQKSMLEQTIRDEYEAKLQQHLASMAKPPATAVSADGDVKMD